jgi:ubiquinone/menaquinone biosynthesis C-methylase UbiE
MALNASRRADMPAGTEGILDVRSLAADHGALAALLRPGMTVLDAGCGTGAITVGIAQAVSPGGMVCGIDVNARLIARAEAAYAGQPNVRFEVADIRDERWEAAFDIVTSARVLQWLADPARALAAMMRAARPGGTIAVLDYDHTQAEWDPPLPSSVRRFYQAFLDWRADAGLDNAIAAHLAGMFGQAGLADVRAVDQHEVTTAGDADYQRRIALWPDVIASRGHQVVADGWLTEADRALAEKDIRRWIAGARPAQTLFLQSVTGTRPQPAEPAAGQ